MQIMYCLCCQIKTAPLFILRYQLRLLQLLGSGACYRVCPSVPGSGTGVACMRQWGEARSIQMVP